MAAIEQAEDLVPATTAAPLRRALGMGGTLVAWYLLQTVVSVITLAILGKLGDAALAGMGAAGVLYAMTMALLVGFDTGVQAITARLVGAGEGAQLGRVLNEALVASAPFGVLLALGFWRYGAVAVGLMLRDPAAVSAGSAFVAPEAASLAFLAVTIPFNAIWIASGRPWVTFWVTVVTSALQALLTVWLVFGGGPVAPMGIAGAGLAGSLDTFAGLIIQMTLGLKALPIPGLLRARPSLQGVLRILAIGWPVSAQQCFLQVGLLISFVIVARLGTASAAAANVLVTLAQLPIQVSMALGVTTGVLAGQALGQGRSGAARGWGWRVSGWCAVVLGAIGLVVAFDPAPLLSLFLHTPTTLALADWPARMIGATIGLDALGRVLGFALRGAGATKMASGVPFLSQWVVQIPLMGVAVAMGYGLTGVAAVQAGITVIDAAVLAWFWNGERWTKALAIAAPEPDLRPARRIVILGGAGAGKSTLARRLAERLGLPVVHLDRLIYGPNWRKRDLGAIRADLAASLPSEGWIVEGTYPDLFDLTLPKADLILWIEQPAWRRLWRTWRKTRIHKNAPRADRPDGCEEGFGLTYAKAVLSFGGWSSALEQQLSKASGNRPSRRIKGDRAVSDFVESLAPPH